MTETPIRTMIVDDEPIARRHVRNILSADPQVQIVGECGNGRDAVEAISTLTPDLVLLDIQMPELDGFGVLAAVGVDRMPAVIFVTAYDEYALQAFDVNALDYVLKPVTADRLLLAVNRAKQRLRTADPASRSLMIEQLRHLLNETSPEQRVPDRIAVKVDGKHIFLATSSIDWVEAVDDYVRLHIGRTNHLVRGTLQSFEKQLPSQFLRIHRSVIVNTQQVREASSTLQGDYRLTLHDGTRLPSGRSYRGAVAAFLKTFAIDVK